ncbi:uncharacterized protein LACBIDRAFT_334588 [Laccaria bicolor S238N-H82]|uniref:Predicted protein n=1 Tax=Laccaria bicolor (strain S238N-H82 / ATCC MYA-4686) TaxID=486041 RepID=B0DZK8_LACBS|nr:uncharacterized protein LACBIDRAFT_334588 [Laccaria bicolor S238N-H82]EDQ99956.1 predicted protein [Laccaria bicolor S238N-H82]|eukprot:XP_001889367.1 predicted protein [Laccaria bicolor S238N-H82]
MDSIIPMNDDDPIPLLKGKYPGRYEDDLNQDRTGEVLMPLSDSYDRDDYVKYPVNTIRGMKRHPVKCTPRQIIPLMGIPDVLPVLPITPTPISGFPDTVSISGIDYSIKGNHANMLPFYHLRNFIVVLVEWCRGDREPTSGTIPSSKGRYAAELFRRVAADQNDDALDPYDLAVLLALAQDQKFGHIQPEEGIYTTRIFYPSSTCEEMIFITARVPEETISALENDEFGLRKVEIFKSTASLGRNEAWTKSEFLKALVTLMEEIILTAASTVKPRGGFFGDDGGT